MEKNGQVLGRKIQKAKKEDAKQSCYVALDDYLSVLHLDILENNWKFKLTTVYWRQDRKGAGIWPFFTPIFLFLKNKFKLATGVLDKAWTERPKK